MLIGEYQHTLDPKGRINFPAKLRESLGDCFVITKGLDNCLFVHPMEEWAHLKAKLDAMPMSKGRAIQLFFFGGAAEVEPDKQGRVLIPQSLREYAGLDKDVVIVGASVRAEIWDVQRYAEECAKLNSASIAEAMDELGF